MTTAQQPALIRYDAMRSAIQEARSVDEAKDIKDKAQALLAYARQRKDPEMARWLAEIKLRARRRIGEISATLANGSGPGRGKKVPDDGKVFKSTALKSAGVSTSEAHRCESIASVPASEFEEYISEAAKRGQEVNANEVERKVAKKRKRKKKIDDTKKAVAAVRKMPDGVRIDVARMEDFLPTLHDLDAIITDPPYPEKFLPLYGELARLAKGALKPDGVLAVMCGQSYLPRIMADMCAHMPYRWMMAYLTPGGQAVQAWSRKINAFWKPILVFGALPSKWSGDVVKSDVNDKRFHEWGQSESGMSYLVDSLTEPGQTVCDPFLGAGTTGVVCASLGRKFVGCDIDGEEVKTAKGRIVEVMK